MGEASMPITELIAAAADMAAVLDREPQLGDSGFRMYDRSKTPEQRAAELRLDRDQMRGPGSLAAFMAARRWLSPFAKTKALYQRGTSYGLKHVAENEIGYTTNGVFIAAAIAEGFTVKRADNGPNALLNISAKAWRM